MGKYDDYSFRELQLAVKERGMTANGSKKELISKLENAPVAGPKVNTVTTDERLDKLEALIHKMIGSTTTPSIATTEVASTPSKDDDFDEDLYDEEEEEQYTKVNNIEPKVFQADSREEVKEKFISGGAPEGMLLNDFLIRKGISYNELNTILKNYLNKVDSRDTVRVSSIDDIERYEKDGIERAKEIDKSERTRMEITGDIHLVDALRKMGWLSVGINGSTHILERA